MVPARTARSPSSNHRRIDNHSGRTMRHQKKTVRLGRTAEHRKALLANQVCALIEHQRIKTTLAKAKAVRPLAEKMVTLGKKGSIHARRNALATLRQKTAVKKLFDQVAPRSTDRNGGYTRIVRLGRRKSDSAPMAFIEWVDAQVVEEKAAEAGAPQQKKEKAVEAKELAPEPKESTPVPAEECKPKRRGWLGRKSRDAGK